MAKALPARRRSRTDRQSFIYTKVPDWVWDGVLEYATAERMTMYAATRRLLYIGLSSQLGTRCSLGGTENHEAESITI